MPPFAALAAAVLSALLTAGSEAGRRQDRPAYEITPRGAPVWLDDPIFFESGPMLSVSVRNRESEAAFVTLGVYAFDTDGRLRATSTLCLGDPIGGTSRARINRPLEFRGVTTRQRVVVTVLEVVTEHARWTLRQPEPVLLDVARRRANGYGVGLAMNRTPADGLPDPLCPCDLEATETACRTSCGGTLRAYTCSPWFPGCTRSCSCGA
jgi:hypothetical protein